MTTHACEQHSSRRSAIGGGVKVAKADTLICQSTQTWRVDLTAIGRDIGITQIIGKNKNNIRAC